ncbi:LAME_0D04478g1_1 [Lachancea meyersii CBS 8951]|uniref:LAME_0D04478g1_1 n=1 Tax=Lachancea meyersii CBS 8951 TaxID=1266667 RepID=A0A1G4J849_9SACH|nr:LAME_0D04478g1_1 [Lachancea meyersii CBS 8951]
MTAIRNSPGLGGAAAQAVNAITPNSPKDSKNSEERKKMVDSGSASGSGSGASSSNGGRKSPGSRGIGQLNRSASVKSMNPLKKIFHRSQSHHESAERSRPERSPLGSDQKVRNRSSSFLQRMHPQHHAAGAAGAGQQSQLQHREQSQLQHREQSQLQHREQSQLQHREQSQLQHRELSKQHSSLVLNNAKSHNVNPFITSRNNGFESPFSALGRGTDIAAPRQSYMNASNPMSRKTSSNESNMVYNPYGTLSKNNTSSSQHDLSFYMQDGKEELPLLPTPLKDPNEYLPEGYKQFSVQLADNFSYPERNSADDLNLGSGGSSDVRTVRSAFHKKELYALKKFKLLRGEKAEHFYMRCSKEFIMAKRLSKSPHIANTFYLVKVSTTTFMTRGWAFIMEYCPGGDLYSLIIRPDWKKRLLKEKFEYWRQIFEGIKFVHSQGVVHRDIKPENVLITQDGLAKLTDFGISDWGHENPDDLSSPIKLFDNYVGSPPYTAPEVMCFNDENATKQDKKPYDAHKMDLWALGVMLFTLVYQSTPFMEAYKTDSRYRSYVLSYDNFVDHNNPQFKKKGNHKPGPGSEFHFGREFQNTGASRVAWRLADPDIKTRYTIDDVIADPWWIQISEGCVEPVNAIPKEPELRNSSYDSSVDKSQPTSSRSTTNSEEELVMHTSNPFLNQNQSKNKSKSMLSIAESPPSEGIMTQARGGESLATLNEERAVEEEVDSKADLVNETERATTGDSVGEESMRNLSIHDSKG